MAVGRGSGPRAARVVARRGALAAHRAPTLGASPVTLGPRTLRAETAAVAGLAILVECAALLRGRQGERPAGSGAT